MERKKSVAKNAVKTKKRNKYNKSTNKSNKFNKLRTNRKYKNYKKKGGEYNYGFNQKVVLLLSSIISEIISTIQKRIGVTFFDFLNQHYDTYKNTFEITEGILNRHPGLKEHYIGMLRNNKEIDAKYVHMTYVNRQVVLNFLQSLQISLQDEVTRQFVFTKINEKIVNRPLYKRGGQDNSQFSRIPGYAPVPPPRKPGLKRTDGINDIKILSSKNKFHNLTFIAMSIIQYILNLIDKSQWFVSPYQNGYANKVNTSNFMHEFFDVIGNNRIIMMYLNEKTEYIANYIYDKYLNKNSIYMKIKILEDFFNDQNTKQTIIKISEIIEKSPRTEVAINKALNEYIEKNRNTKEMHLKQLIFPIFTPGIMGTFSNLTATVGHTPLLFAAKQLSGRVKDLKEKLSRVN
jgi:hypothetical protein